MDTAGRMPNNSSRNKTEALWEFSWQNNGHGQNTNKLPNFHPTTTVILGSEHCFIYKQIASDLMVQIFNETKPLQYLQLDLPIQIIRKIFKRMFNLFKNTHYERVGAVFLNSQWTKLHDYFLVLLNNFLTWMHPCLLFWEQCSPESLQVTMVYTAESLPDNLYTGLDIQPG